MGLVKRVLNMGVLLTEVLNSFFSYRTGSSLRQCLEIKLNILTSQMGARNMMKLLDFWTKQLWVLLLGAI